MARQIEVRRVFWRLAVVIGAVELVWIYLDVGSEAAVRALVVIAVALLAIIASQPVSRWAGYVVHSRSPGLIVEIIGWLLLFLPLIASRYRF